MWNEGIRDPKQVTGVHGEGDYLTQTQREEALRKRSQFGTMAGRLQPMYEGATLRSYHQRIRKHNAWSDDDNELISELTLDTEEVKHSEEPITNTVQWNSEVQSVIQGDAKYGRADQRK